MIISVCERNSWTNWQPQATRLNWVTSLFTSLPSQAPTVPKLEQVFPDDDIAYLKALYTNKENSMLEKFRIRSVTLENYKEFWRRSKSVLPDIVIDKTFLQNHILHRFGNHVTGWTSCSLYILDISCWNISRGACTTVTLGCVLSSDGCALVWDKHKAHDAQEFARSFPSEQNPPDCPRQ